MNTYGAHSTLELFNQEGNLLKKFLIFLIALASAAMASQYPEYAQQYRQRLGGAVQELRGYVERFDTDAAKSGLNRNQALGRYDHADDDFLNDRGQSIGDTVRRFERLDQHYRDMNDANPFRRLWIFAKNRDPEIARDTLDIFEPAIPMTMAGAAYAAGGFLAAWLVLSILLAPFGRKQHRRSRRGRRRA